ncbi:hypothetical protein NX059_001698 [Plenodomus lindquistii]|nr:hypothetical protein NX059_001698 [Plenodomus lindquistii]
MANNNKTKHNANARHATKLRGQDDQSTDSASYRTTDTQALTTPLWDDSTGVIYSIPAVPPRNPAREFGFINDRLQGDDTSRAAPPSPSPTRTGTARGNPFVNDAIQPPRAPRAMLASRTRPAPLDPESWTRWHKEYVPYLEPEDVRNVEDLGHASDTNQPATISRPTLVAKDVKRKISDDKIEMNKLASSKGDASKGEMAKLKRGPATPRCTSHLGLRPMAVAVEGPVAAEIIKQASSQPRSHRRTSSTTLEKIRSMRAEEIPVKSVKMTDPEDLGTTATAPLKSCMRKSTSSAVDSNDIESAAKAVRDMAISRDLSGRQSGYQVAEPSEVGQTEQADANSSSGSVASSGADGFEAIVMPLWDETEKNGGKKKWYQLRK